MELNTPRGDSNWNQQERNNELESRTVGKQVMHKKLSRTVPTILLSKPHPFYVFSYGATPLSKL